MTRSIRRGFTLVELLVVIGIIAILIGTLLPALHRARLQALRTQDLSNIRQMAVAATNYAAVNRGAFPVGTKGYGGEDMAWINNPTADYLLQYCTDSNRIFSDLTTNKDLGRMLCCNAEFENASAFSVLQAQYYSSNEEQLGWVYWGGRALTTWAGYASGAAKTPFVVTIVNRDGTSGGNYTMPLKQGDKATTKTLFTCFSFLSPASYGGTIPHQASGDFVATTASGSNPYVFMKKMAGMSMSYTDGSARFVPAGELGAVVGGYSWYYYDTKAN